ncbi:NINE protein [Methylomicrobium sp. Wu6]|uniref:NINE protein n=1 Tax=Methylomicrobium sp. Wu6 TaxID=3107928 RepID=UPI002DD6341C|nr:NINE protein [Methylomicrobium sp. Wu6]MEC4748805.1 NINE protein [Methylomicrobium sp. Wu6]
MRGKIASFDPEAGAGLIDSEGQTYPFALEDWTDGVPPEDGDDIRFGLEDGKAVRVALVGVSLEEPKAVKYKYLAGALSLLLGWAGLGRIYLGYYRIGIYQILLTAILVRAGFIPFAPQWGFIEAALLFSGNMNKDAKGRPLK